MTLSVGSLRGANPGRAVVDHRLARTLLAREVRKGRVAREQVCDAHPELIRAATNVGTAASSPCPICDEDGMRLVTYVFGARLPKHGRCVSSAKEMRELDRRHDELSAYVVEACICCHWHHLLRVMPIGRRAS